MKRMETADEGDVLMDRSQPLVAHLSAVSAGKDLGAHTAEQLPGQRPVDEANGRLERTGPVRTQSTGAGGDPAFKLREKCLNVSRVAAETVSLGQRDQL